jgi:hypothetical protein
MTNIFISERGILYRQPYQCSYMQTHTVQCWKICLSLYMLAYKVHYQTTALLQLCLRLHTYHSTYCFVWHNLHSNNTGLLSAYKHIRFHISNTCAIYEGSRAVADTVQPCTRTGFRTCEQEGLSGDRQWQQWVPRQCGCYGGWEILWSSFTGTTSMITGRVYSTFQCSGNTQPRFSKYLWRLFPFSSVVRQMPG